MKKIIFCLTVLTALFLLTGCRKNETKNNGISLSDEAMADVATEDERDICYLRWAVPDDSIFVKDEWIDKINGKLRADGYEFRLKLVRIVEDENHDYEELVYSCNADIVFTGNEDYKDRYAMKGMINGKYADLTDYINNGKLKEIIPEKLLQAISYKDRIYLLPNEWGIDGAYISLINTRITDNRKNTDFKNNIFLIDDEINTENKVYYGLDRFDFVRFFGYYYDSVNGVVADKDGNIIDPFTDDRCTEWMRLVNKWYTEGSAPDPMKFGQKDLYDKFAILFLSGETDKEKKGTLEIWDTELCNRYLCSTAIRSDSGNIDYAFEFLELLRTDHSYGNLLIYGTESEDELEPDKMYYINKIVFGLDDGLIRDDDFKHFSSAEERKEFYENSVTLSPTVYMDLPFECYELSGIVNYYLRDNSILFKSDFEKNLELFQKEYNTALEKIFEKSDQKINEKVSPFAKIPWL